MDIEKLAVEVDIRVSGKKVINSWISQWVSYVPAGRDVLSVLATDVISTERHHLPSGDKGGLLGRFLE